MALGFVKTNILNDICREISLYIYPPKVDVFEHKKTDVGIYPLFVNPQLFYSYFFQASTYFYRCVSKIIPQSTGLVRLSPENFDNINVSGESVIFGG